jgi:hypothetical protein
MLKNRMIELALAAAAACAAGCGTSDDSPAKSQAQSPGTTAPAEIRPAEEKYSAIKFVPQATPKGGVPHESWKGVPLGDASDKGLKWLVSVQGKDGGWGQDGGNEGDVRKEVGLESQGNDLANTSLVCLALLRSGNTMADGPYRDALRKGVDFVLRHVEAAKEEGLQVTDRQGTQIQRKLGPYIDTFLSTMLLSEIDGRMADDAGQKRVRASLGKCIAKVEKNQHKDGSWNQGGGWAPIISTSIASRSLYNAQLKGNTVDQSCLDKVEKYTASNFDPKTRNFKGEAAAGVELYVAAQSFEQASRPTTMAEADAAPRNELRQAAQAKLGAANFVAGFGSMGGEEFVSYLNISDSLLRSGGKEWADWNGKIKERLVTLQNQDGTWAGHHCITGRVACTSAAVMTLLAERTIAKS